MYYKFVLLFQEQYVFLYEVAKDYINAFSEYANFRWRPMAMSTTELPWTVVWIFLETLILIYYRPTVIPFFCSTLFWSCSGWLLKSKQHKLKWYASNHWIFSIMVFWFTYKLFVIYMNLVFLYYNRYALCNAWIYYFYDFELICFRALSMFWFGNWPSLHYFGISSCYYDCYVSVIRKAACAKHSSNIHFTRIVCHQTLTSCVTLVFHNFSKTLVFRNARHFNVIVFLL